jgi:hypothetical protein
LVTMDKWVFFFAWTTTVRFTEKFYLLDHSIITSNLFMIVFNTILWIQMW